MHGSFCNYLNLDEPTAMDQMTPGKKVALVPKKVKKKLEVGKKKLILDKI